MTATSLLPLFAEDSGRQGSDRLEILTALIGGPSVDPVFATEVIRVPRNHPVYRWNCLVEDCERVRTNTGLCTSHREQRVRSEAAGDGMAGFLAQAVGLEASEWFEETMCCLCPQRPATQARRRLCLRHQSRWWRHRRRHGDHADFTSWVAGEETYPGFGGCRVAVCPSSADGAIGLCAGHATAYEHDDSPGGAQASRDRVVRREHERHGTPIPVDYRDEVAFRRWCAAAKPVLWPGQVNLQGLRPLLRAEIQWCLSAYTQRPRPGRWDLKWMQRLADLCREQDLNSLVDLDLENYPRFCHGIAEIMLHLLRLVYFTPDDSRDAGFVETDHFGVRFPERASHVDLTAVPQRWLRNLLWDYLADLLRSPSCPRSRGPIDNVRRGITELGVFLEFDAPDGGHDPTGLTVEHMQRFVADQRHRERDGLPSLAMTRVDGTPSTVTTVTRGIVFNSVRKVMRDTLDSGRADQLGLDRQFLTAMPAAGGAPLRARRPFPDEVAAALGDETNLTRLAESDPQDQGLRDMWEIIVTTGRRTNEVIKLRWDCIGRYSGLAMFWHDQTKVGNYDAAIRIPERLYDLLATRQTKTLERYMARHGRQPTDTQRAAMALFPSKVRNTDGTVAISSQWFRSRFNPWVEELNLGRWVPHQARHTLATSLLRHGATLTHIRRYLGHISERMAEHYVHLSHSDLEDVLHRVWVAGPGTANPGELLSSVDIALTREQAQALAIDLSRRSTPADGGVCTFQPVVDGGACPYNLDCHNCDKFVLSGADLLYWRRKGEQWRQLAEGAPDDATADYLHQHFEPTARAIAGLEQALAGLGLLDDALALDLRKPQDYFHRVWSTAFAAADLADAAGDNDGEPDTLDQEGHP